MTFKLITLVCVLLVRNNSVFIEYILKNDLQQKVDSILKNFHQWSQLIL